VTFRLNTERKLIIGIGGLLLLLALGYNAAPWFESAAPGKELLLIQQQQLSKYRQKLKGKTRLENQLKTYQARLRRLEAGLLKSKTPSLSAVDIQKVLGDIAEKTQAEVKTMRILSSGPAVDVHYLAVPVQITLLSDIQQLTSMLHEIENSKQLLKVKDIVFRSAGARHGGNILTTLTVEGFMRTGGA
jgi:hypothetical protein